jgi:hypothetical protein
MICTSPVAVTSMFSLRIRSPSRIAVFAEHPFFARHRMVFAQSRETARGQISAMQGFRAVSPGSVCVGCFSGGLSGL